MSEFLDVVVGILNPFGWCGCASAQEQVKGDSMTVFDLPDVPDWFKNPPKDYYAGWGSYDGPPMEVFYNSARNKAFTKAIYSKCLANVPDGVKVTAKFSWHEEKTPTPEKEQWSGWYLNGAHVFFGLYPSDKLDCSLVEITEIK